MSPTIQIRTIARVAGETWAVAIPRVETHGIDGGTITTRSRDGALGLAHLVAGYLGVPAEVWDDAAGRWLCAHPMPGWAGGICGAPTPCSEHQPNPEQQYQEQP